MKWLKAKATSFNSPKGWSAPHRQPEEETLMELIETFEI